MMRRAAGSVHGVGGYGSVSVPADPTGAHFALWKPKKRAFSLSAMTAASNAFGRC